MKILVALFLSTFAAAAARADEATDWVAKVERNTLGESFAGTVSLSVKNPDYTRTMKAKLWTETREKALIKLLEPAKDRNTGNLRLKLDLWQYLPNVERVVKIPTSMMLQSWMGSDFTNDDLVRGSSLLRDYTHALLGKESVENAPGEKIQVAKIQCTPKPTAPVVWGKIVLWVKMPEGTIAREEFYTEKGEKVKELVGSRFKTFGAHTLPTRLVMSTLKKGSSTEMVYEDAAFDRKAPAAFFSQESLRKNVGGM